MEYKDYYKILGVDKNADEKTIKNAYRKLAKKYHPDLNQGDNKSQEKFKEVNEAYEVLSDKDKRAKYDAFGSNYDFSGGYNFDPSAYGYSYTTSGGSSEDFSDFFDMIFGSSARRGRKKSGGSYGFNFDNIFSQNSGSFSSKSHPKAKYESELTISIDEAYRGTTKNVSLSINNSLKDMEVKIPKGITRGKKIKIKGERYDLDGDILFRINIKDEKFLKLDGIDLYKIVEIYPWQEALGEEKTVETFEGKVKVKIPKNRVYGQKLRIPNKGFKDMKGNTGDMFIEFALVNPQNLSKEQIELYKKLEEIS